MMEYNIKMIALDMDGTVLTDAKEITDYTKYILEKAMEDGIVVLACTGRPANAIPRVFTDLKGIRYAISSNGARIVDMHNEKVLYEQLLSVDDTKKILSIAEQYDTYREVFWEGQGYTSKDMFASVQTYFNNFMTRYISETRIQVEELNVEVEEKDAPCDKIHIAFADMKERAEAIEKLKSIGKFEYNGALHNNMEVTAPGTSKGSSILRLGEILGIKKQEIMAIGDGMNDASMLRAVGVPVAMGNAVDDLKELAVYITESNNEDGVANAVEKLAIKH